LPRLILSPTANFFFSIFLPLQKVPFVLPRSFTQTAFPFLKSAAWRELETLSSLGTGHVHAWLRPMTSSPEIVSELIS